MFERRTREGASATGRVTGTFLDGPRAGESFAFANRGVAFNVAGDAYQPHAKAVSFAADVDVAFTSMSVKVEKAASAHHQYVSRIWFHLADRESSFAPPTPHKVKRTFKLPMKDGRYPSFAAAEWAARRLTFTRDLLDDADLLVWHAPGWKPLEDRIREGEFLGRSAARAARGARPMQPGAARHADAPAEWGAYDVVIVAKFDSRTSERRFCVVPLMSRMAFDFMRTMPVSVPQGSTFWALQVRKHWLLSTRSPVCRHSIGP